MSRKGTYVPVERSNTLEVRTPEDVLKVRREVRNRTAVAGFGLVDQTKFVTAASEIARNTIDHGGRGTVRIETLQERSKRGVRLTFEDHGPGIADLKLAMQDGYSTAGGLGMGLPGAKRLRNEFYVDSSPGKGTKVILIRWKPV
jgi:serine/threonine-protein kinase RsbT